MAGCGDPEGLFYDSVLVVEPSALPGAGEFCKRNLKCGNIWRYWSPNCVLWRFGVDRAGFNSEMIIWQGGISVGREGRTRENVGGFCAGQKVQISLGDIRTSGTGWEPEPGSRLFHRSARC